MNAGASGGILNTVDGGQGLAKIFNFVGDLKQHPYSGADLNCSRGLALEGLMMTAVINECDG